nr:immunoglobulin light chain junction region [Macaca mulatta]
CQHNYGPPFTF